MLVKKRVWASISYNDFERLQKQAERVGKNPSELIRDIIHDYVAKL